MGINENLSNCGSAILLLRTCNVITNVRLRGAAVKRLLPVDTGVFATNNPQSGFLHIFHHRPSVIANGTGKRIAL